MHPTIESPGCLPVIYLSPLVVVLKDGPSLLVTCVRLFSLASEVQSVIPRLRTLSGEAARNMIRHWATITTELQSNPQPVLSLSRCILLLLCAVTGIRPPPNTLTWLEYLPAKLSPWPGWAVVRQNSDDRPEIKSPAPSPASRQPFTHNV